MKTIRQSFRFGDLAIGDKFFADGRPHSTLTVGSHDMGGNAWEGNHKTYFHENAPITPVDVATVARSKCAAYRKLARQFGLTYAELQSGYRSLVVATHRPYSLQRLPITDIDSPLCRALIHCGLIFMHNGQHYVSGESRRFYI